MADIALDVLRLADPRLGEEELEAVRRVFSSGHLTNGAEVPAFEEEFASRHAVAHAIAMANGTVALTAIHLALGCTNGAEIIVPSLTFVSTATSVLHAGAVPVFADIEGEGFMLDPAAVSRAITPRTKAICPVHYGGQAAALDELRQLADERGLALIEDAAQAHGAEYKGTPVGGHGTAAMFSFTPTKNLTTGEGAIVTTNDGQLADRLRRLRNHGQSALYRHDSLGFNWRMSDINAAIGRVQLGRLDAILERKSAIVDRLRSNLEGVSGLRLPIVLPGRTHPFMLFTVLVDGDRDTIAARLGDMGVESRVYFPPVHQQPIFREWSVELPVTEWVAERILSVPVHHRLTDDDVDRVAESVRTALL